MPEAVAAPVSSLRNVQRLLRTALPNEELTSADATLETWGMSDEPPRLASCDLVEDQIFGSHAVLPPYSPTFSAFLDGTQRSQPVCFVGGVPIVFAKVAAVIRERVDRRMVTWRQPLMEGALFADAARLPHGVLAALAAAGVELHDTRPPHATEEGVPHPNALLQQAVRSVQARRERLEQLLAAEWCSVPKEGEKGVASQLLIDGGLPASEGVSSNGACVGVVKSHHTLYTPHVPADVIYALEEGERTSVFRVSRSWGPSVHSWYLRLRRERGRDPFWGLVRVEVSVAGDAAGSRQRADEVSAWILAERTPIALPDGRWDRMVYGVRDCEEYLRARG